MRKRFDKFDDIHRVDFGDWSRWSDEVPLLCQYDPEIVCYGLVIDIIGVLSLFAFTIFFLLITFFGFFGICVRPTFRLRKEKHSQEKGNDKDKDKDKDKEKDKDKDKEKGKENKKGKEEKKEKEKEI